LFKNNRNLLVTFGGILASLLAVSMGSNVDDVYASTGAGNSTAPQTLNITEALDIIRPLKEKSNGNTTQLTMLLFDEAEKRNMINENDKKELAAYLVGFNKIKPARNITDIDVKVISLINNIGDNSSNPTLATLKSTLKSIAPDIGTNTATLISNFGNNTIPGLPPFTIDDIGDFAARNHLDGWARCQSAMAVGTLLGPTGALAGGVLCAIV
jgi:hypothetical protein